MRGGGKGIPESSPGSIFNRSKRPVSLWVVSVYVFLSGFIALVMSWQAPSFLGLGKTLGVVSALVQTGSGILLLLGLALGRRLYLFAVPVVILGQALYLGSVIGFTDDDFPIQGLSSFLVYGVVAFFLMRKPVRNWFAEDARSRHATESEKQAGGVNN